MLHTVWFHLYNILNDKTIGVENRSMVSRCGEGGGETIKDSTREPVCDELCILTFVELIWKT